MSYHDNFDEFGNLRENHSKWTIAERVILALFLLAVAGIASGVLG